MPLKHGFCPSRPWYVNHWWVVPPLSGVLVHLAAGSSLTRP
jgi:hypothetical protein